MRVNWSLFLLASVLPALVKNKYQIISPFHPWPSPLVPAYCLPFAEDCLNTLPEQASASGTALEIPPSLLDGQTPAIPGQT